MDDCMYTLLKDVLGDRQETMVRVDAMVDIAGDDWISAANEAALRLNAYVEPTEQASQFALLARRPNYVKE